MIHLVKGLMLIASGLGVSYVLFRLTDRFISAAMLEKIIDKILVPIFIILALIFLFFFLTTAYYIGGGK